MKFVYHYTGEWERSDCNTAATRSPGFVREYQNLNAIDDAWIKSQFQTALELGEPVLIMGGHVFQLRD